MKGFLEYVDGTSFLHAMNPMAKLVCALLLAIAAFTAHSVVFLAVLILLDYVLAIVCRMVRQTLGLTKAIVIFALLLGVLAILTTKPAEGAAILVELPWGSISTTSLLSALLIFMRLVAAAIPMFLVFYVTKVNDMANAAVKVLHVPYRYAFTFSSTVKFIPTFLNDMSGIMEAQTARGVEFDGSIAKRIRLMVPLCVPLLVNSVRKINSSAIAAEVRGFNLRRPDSGYKEYPLRAVDFLALAVCVVALVLGIIF